MEQRPHFLIIAISWIGAVIAIVMTLQSGYHVLQRFERSSTTIGTVVEQHMSTGRNDHFWARIHFSDRQGNVHEFTDSIYSYSGAKVSVYYAENPNGGIEFMSLSMWDHIWLQPILWFFLSFSLATFPWWYDRIFDRGIRPLDFF